MRKARIYYGMSGTFKTQKLKFDSKGSNHLKMNSGIKNWKDWENKEFKEYLNKTNSENLNFALLHLSRLQDYVDLSLIYEKDLFIERGISDMLFFHNKYGREIREEQLNEIINLETKLLSEFEIEKILLIQQDNEFIKNVIFKEESRKNHFQSLEDYQLSQTQYLEFTIKNNSIDEIISIQEAKSFIENQLNQTYED